MDAKLAAVPLVDIDEEGRFKYILIKVYAKELPDGSEPSKLIVRGFRRAEWHGNSVDNSQNRGTNIFIFSHAVLFSHFQPTSTMK